MELNEKVQAKKKNENKIKTTEHILSFYLEKTKCFLPLLIRICLNIFQNFTGITTKYAKTLSSEQDSVSMT